MLYILPYDGQRTILQLRYNDTIFYHIIRKHKTTPFSEIIFLERENMSKFKKKLKKTPSRNKNSNKFTQCFYSRGYGGFNL